jgi:uncharacterized membrane protein
MMHSLLDAWSDPHTRHAMLVHLPLALGLLGVIPLLALAYGGFRSEPLRRVSIGLFLFLSFGAWMAAQAGHEALESIRRGAALSDGEVAVLEVHEWRGQSAWMWPLLPAALVAVAGTGGRVTRVAAGSASVAAGLGVAAWFCVIGHAGGQLVYAHGLGVPTRQPAMLEASADPASTPAQPTEP